MSKKKSSKKSDKEKSEKKAEKLSKRSRSRSKDDTDSKKSDKPKKESKSKKSKSKKATSPSPTTATSASASLNTTPVITTEINQPIPVTNPLISSYNDDSTTNSQPMPNQSAQELKLKHSFDLSPKKSEQTSSTAKPTTTTETSQPGPTNLLKTSIKSFSIKKISALTARPVLVTSPSKKIKLDKSANNSETSNTPTNTEASSSSLKREISELTHILTSPKIIDAIINQDTGISTKSEKSSKEKNSNKESKSKRHKESKASRSRSRSRTRRKQRSRSKSHSKKATAITSSSTITTPSKSQPTTASLSSSETPSKRDEPKTKGSRRSRSKSPKAKRDTKQTLERSSSAKELHLDEEHKKTRASDASPASMTTTMGTKLIDAKLNSEQRTPVKNSENSKYIELPSLATEEHKNKSLNASGGSSRDKKHSSSSHRNRHATQSKTHGSNRNSSRRYDTNTTPSSAHKKRKYREYSSRSRSRSRSYTPRKGNRNSRSTSRTSSRGRSSRSSSYSSSYSSSSSYSMRSKNNPTKYEKHNRSRTNSQSQHQTSKQYDSNKFRSHRESSYHRSSHRPQSSSRGYYASSSSTSYRSGYYGNQQGTGTSSPHRYNRSNSASKNTDQSVDGIGKDNQNEQGFRSNTLRHVKTDGDMSNDQMNQQNFYRNHSSNSPYKMSRNNLQNLPYYQQNSQYNNNKRYLYNNNNHMGHMINNVMGNHNNSHSFGGNGSMHSHHAMPQSSHHHHGAAQLNEASQLNGAAFNINLPIDVNLEDLQNEANNRSDESVFDETSSSDENTLDFLDSEFQDLQKLSNDDINNTENSQPEWSILEQPRFSFIQNRETTMFDSMFNKQNLVHKNLTKLPVIFGSDANYLNLVRTELAGTEPENDSNNFILVNCLLNRSFSKIRLEQFFNLLHQCPDPGDKTRVSYSAAEVEKRQRMIDAFGEKTEVSVDGSKEVGEQGARSSCVEDCLELFRKEGLFP